MAGHSHWAKIKRAKGANDAKRGKLFSKIGRKIFVAARNGGPDPAMNVPLRYAIDEGRAVNMPNEAIERNLARATGEAGGTNYENATYEAFFGTAGLIIEALTDNRNRTISEVRPIVEKRGGKMAPSGAVSHMFSKKGVIIISRFTEQEQGRKTVKVETPEDKVMEAAMDAGAEDFLPTAESYEVRTLVPDFDRVRKALSDKGFKLESAEVVSLSADTMTLDADMTRRLLEMIEMLEDNDDVQRVFHNAEISEEVAA